MIVGIVGSEGAKFTDLGRARAEELIAVMLEGADALSSGHCHLGGIDIFAEDYANDLGIKTLIFPPKQLSWEGGYKQRNLQIAQASDVVHCISVDRLPEGFSGMRFKTCYHCANFGRDATSHAKSGGCWTVNQALKMGKAGLIHVVANY